MNTLEVLINLAVSDSELQNIVLSDNETNRQLRGAMVPFLLTRNKVFSIDHQDAALKKMYSFGKISTERALWQDIIESVKNDDSKYFHHYHLNTSRTIMDAYYGDMGGICLARETSSIKNLRMFNIRLISEKDKEVVGMAILHASNRGLASYKPNCGVFLHVFAINPLRSILTSMSTKQQLLMYLNYRKLFETFSIRTKKIIVLSGVVDQYIISNDWSFREIIVNYELKNHAKKVNDAYGLSIIYKEDEFAQALVIIDPSRPETFRADEAIKIITSKEN